MLNQPEFGCNMSSVSSDDFEYSVYHRYLGERDLDEDTFLDELSSTMLEESSVLTHGKLLDYDFVTQKSVNSTFSRVLYSAYPGTASVFAVVVKYKNNASAIYVTAATYACVFEGGEYFNCRIMWHTATKVR